MKIEIRRNPSNAACTIGKLYIDGVFTCYTLEDVVREVIGQRVSVWKIKGQTAIPSTLFTGYEYLVTLEKSARFGPDTITIHDVPGFTSIRVHKGNGASDTEGCPLLGMSASATGIVAGTSGPAVSLVKGRIAEALNAGDTVTLSITNSEHLA